MLGAYLQVVLIASDELSLSVLGPHIDYRIYSNMAYLLREGNVTVLHCDGDKLRAAFGVQEFFARPTVVRPFSDLLDEI
jgi:hypothetical protein